MERKRRHPGAREGRRSGDLAVSHPGPQAHSPCRDAGRGAASDGKSAVEANLPVPRLVLLALRGLALACPEEPVLPVVLPAFLAAEAPSRCLVVAAAAPPAGLEEADRAAPCCFLA